MTDRPGSWLPSWELRSNLGDAVARWLPLDRPSGAQPDAIAFDLELSSSYSGHAADSPPVRVEAKQLTLWRSDLEDIENRLRAWVDLPLARVSGSPLKASFVAGATFDNFVTLDFGPREDTLSGHNQVATFTLNVGKLRGEFVFVTDQSCIRLLCDGIRGALEALPKHK